MPLTHALCADPRAGLGRHQRLLDVYGALLTEHQREACRLHLDEDWSFAELAEQLACSRSGAHDLVRRGLAHLDHLEARLGLAAELTRLEARIADLESGPRAVRGRVR